MSTSNPLSTIDDDTLWNSQLLLMIQCNRVRYSLRHHLTGNLCALGVALKIEADNRGVQSPTAPLNIGKIRNTA